MRPAGRLWRHPDFLKLWAGQSVSLLGTAVTMLALPTTAILVLHAGALQVGLLSAVQRLPFPILGLPAGVWVDRVRRRPLMIAADAGRALAVASVALAAFTHGLTLLHLYIVAALLGVFSVAFDVSYLAYLPSLVGREDLVEGNSKLQVSFSVAALLGPSLAGGLIQLMGAARSMIIDAASYVVSVVALVRIRRAEPAPRDRSDNQPSDMRRELNEGLRTVFGDDILRSLLLCLTIGTAGLYLALPLFLVLVFEDVHMAPVLAGAVFTLEGAGAIVGALLAARCVRILRLGPTIAITQAVAAAAVMGYPLALRFPAVPTLAVLDFVLGFAGVVHDVNQVSLRQGLTPSHLQGRMNATFRTFFWGAWPVASLLGGFLGSTWGHAQTLMLGGGIGVLGSLLVMFTPLRAVRAHPEAAGSTATSLESAASA